MLEGPGNGFGPQLQCQPPTVAGKEGEGAQLTSSHSHTTLTCKPPALLGSQGPRKGTGSPGQGCDPPRLPRRCSAGFKTALERGNPGPELGGEGLRGGGPDPRPQAQGAGAGRGGGGQLCPVHVPLRALETAKNHFRLRSHDRPHGTSACRHAGTGAPANQRSAPRARALSPPSTLPSSVTFALWPPAVTRQDGAVQGRLPLGALAPRPRARPRPRRRRPQPRPGSAEVSGDRPPPPFPAVSHRPPAPAGPPAPAIAPTRPCPPPSFPLRYWP